MIEQQLINGLMLGSIYSLVGVAFSLTIGMLNFLNFSVPGLFMLGGVISYGLLKAGFHWSIAFILTIAAITVVSLVIERFTYRWLRLSSPFIPLVSSIGFLIVIENSAIMRYGSESMRAPTPFKLTDLHWEGLFISAPQLLGLVIALLAAAIMSLMLKRSKLGRSIRGIAENPRTAETLGINVNRTVSSIYVITGIFAAVGGILFALNYQQVAWYMGQEVAAKGLAAMVLGGMGSLWGPVIGGFLVGLIEVFSIAYVSSDAVNAVVYGTLLALLLCWPNGLLGARISTVERM
ncbi:MAG: branched-chain amino acid ABC transporter permease [Hyphomicrobiales bacterium]|nr:branched-chain amino acid ABC transporter permease [Hyphomicrobiales bacterium]MDE1971976.1 branched-chain amino acid ABC transporter permease [Hyphomicrobiales bacterium]MDE2284946.1 branched-chain amino acid ABC transporter permease [Hyphomicrobiales bacterium]